MYVGCSIYITVAEPGFEVRGAHFFRISYCSPPPLPLRGFPVATIKVYLDFFLGFRFANPLEKISWGHYKSIYLDFLGFRFAPPPPPLDHFAWSHYKSLYLDFLGCRFAPPPPPRIRHCIRYLIQHINNTPHIPYAMPSIHQMVHTSYCPYHRFSFKWKHFRLNIK